MRAALLSAALTLACVASAAAGVPGTAGCTVVFGQGRNPAAGDDAANALWDRVNASFNAQVAATLDRDGERVLALVAPVTATDVAANARQMLERAAAAGCRRIVETTIFADADRQVLVARLRGYPILAGDGAAGAGATLRIGEADDVNEREFELDRATLDRVRPAVLGATMAAEMLRRRVGARAAAGRR